MDVSLVHLRWETPDGLQDRFQQACASHELKVGDRQKPWDLISQMAWAEGCSSDLPWMGPMAVNRLESSMRR
jgi:hypothetical protein